MAGKKTQGKKPAAVVAVRNTKRRCAHCGQPIPNNAVYPVLVVGPVGRRLVHYIKGHYTA